MRKQIQDYLKNWEGIEELVRLGIEESSDLDFKQEPYAHPKKSAEKRQHDRFELRRDVAAFSNASGGAIILGIGENNLGQASQIIGVEDLRSSENFVTEVLSHDIAPAFEHGELRVRVVQSPKDPILAVIVLEVDKAQPGHPRAVLRDGLAEFWIREGKSKRPMTYAQIEQDFHGDQEAEEKRRIDAHAKVSVLRIQHQLESASSNWQRIRPLLEQVKEYAAEFRYGLTVKEAVFDAACLPLERARLKIPYDVAESAIDLLNEVLPIHSLVSKAHRPLTEPELALLHRAASAAVDLIYDATRRLRDIIIINTGAKLLYSLLRFAHLNDLVDLKKEILDSFEERISWAEKDEIKDGARLLRFYRDDALTLRDDDLVEFSGDLSWLIMQSPSELPEGYADENV
ncbi:helix-turn-helix domain-containing protein [Pyxidicoccus sp. 3LG]